MSEYWNKGYQLIEDIISQETADLLYNSFDINKKIVEWDTQNNMADIPANYFSDKLVPSHCFSVYGHPTFEALLQQLTPRVSQIVGHECVPSFAFTRMYYPGASMKIHQDRGSCEVSMTLTIKAVGDIWPIWIRGLDNIAHSITIPECSAVLYQGCELDHWREEYIGAEDNNQLNTFLFWVNPNGPNRKYAYDGRPMLGTPFCLDE